MNAEPFGMAWGYLNIHRRVYAMICRQFQYAADCADPPDRDRWPAWMRAAWELGPEVTE